MRRCRLLPLVACVEGDDDVSVFLGQQDTPRSAMKTNSPPSSDGSPRVFAGIGPSESLFRLLVNHAHLIPIGVIRWPTSRTSSNIEVTCQVSLRAKGCLRVLEGRSRCLSRKPKNSRHEVHEEAGSTSPDEAVIGRALPRRKSGRRRRPFRNETRRQRKPRKSGGNGTNSRTN